eukprot:3058748-Amphidinium_carterae.1
MRPRELMRASWRLLACGVVATAVLHAHLTALPQSCLIHNHILVHQSALRAKIVTYYIQNQNVT